MADYRFSAQIIKRSKGQSCVASAAYRSASRLIDERTGEIHDYGRKGGVLHSEVMSPDNTPDWMHDRAQLWNAVEAIERRKDAQLAREIQLSLPHELTEDQRRDLVRSFVQEQFVDRGMIADVAIHAPSAEGDQRNHHAHVMLTMREMTGEGFGKKSRDWNNPDLLNQWREQWAHDQNRALERHGHSARVDHRSYEAQGIDREPQHHLGPVAMDMERNGKASRIGDENREIANDNRAQVDFHMEAVAVQLAMSREKESFSDWVDRKAPELDAAQDLTRLDLDQKHDRQKSRLESQLHEQYGEAKATIKAEVDAITLRLESKGVRKVLRDVFGRTRSDSVAREDMLKTLADIDRRENEQRDALRKQQQTERKALKTKQERQHELQSERLSKGQATKQAEWDKRTKQGKWKEKVKKVDLRPTKGQAKILEDRGHDARSFNRVSAAKLIDQIAKDEGWKTARKQPAKSTTKSATKAAPEVRKSDAPDLATKKRSISPKLDEKGAEMKRAYHRSTATDGKRPYQKSASRGLSSSPPSSGGKK